MTFNIEDNLASRHDLYNLKAITWLDLAILELRWRNGFAIVLDDYTTRQKALGEEE